MADYTKMKGDMANLVAATAGKPAAPVAAATAGKTPNYSERETLQTVRQKTGGIKNSPGPAP